jgi:hypothetical protein
MKNHLVSRLAVGLSSLLALAAFACSGAPSDTGLGTGSKDEAPPTTAKKTGNGATASDTSKTSPAPSTPLADDAACGTKTTSQACGECCIAKNPAAFDAANEVAFTCICAATTCLTACADSVCAATDNQNTPTAACTACLDTNGKTCDDKATAACDASTDCKAIEACLTTSCDPIAAKEGAAGGATPKVLSARAAMRSSHPQ